MQPRLSLDSTSHLHTHFTTNNSCYCEYFIFVHQILAPLLGNRLFCRNWFFCRLILFFCSPLSFWKITLCECDRSQFTCDRAHLHHLLRCVRARTRLCAVARKRTSTDWARCACAIDRNSVEIERTCTDCYILLLMIDRIFLHSSTPPQLAPTDLKQLSFNFWFFFI